MKIEVCLRSFLQSSITSYCYAYNDDAILLNVLIQHYSLTTRQGGYFKTAVNALVSLLHVEFPDHSSGRLFQDLYIGNVDSLLIFPDHSSGRLFQDILGMKRVDPDPFPDHSSGRLFQDRQNVLYIYKSKLIP